MRKRLQIALAVSLTVVGGVIAWQVLREREPVYNGKPASYWIHRSGEAYEGSDFGRIGYFPKADSNAIPYLVRALHWRESRFSKAYFRIWFRSPAWIKNRSPTPVIAEQVRRSTAEALGGMGDTGKAAIPALCGALRNDESNDVRLWAALSLGKLGKGDEQATMALFEVLANKDSPIRRYAASALGEIGTSARIAVPVLIEYLSCDDMPLRSAASDALKQVDPEAAARAGVK